MRDVDALRVGDVDTPVTEVVNGKTVLINDCRVHDRLTFQVPIDLAPEIYQIQVVVPNITGDQHLRHRAAFPMASSSTCFRRPRRASRS